MAARRVAVIDGQLQLGEWQRLFLVELDGPRPQRELLVQVMGQAAPLAADRAPLEFPLARHAVTAPSSPRHAPWPHLGQPLP